VSLAAPLLSENDAFNSHPFLGTIAYRLPGLDELIGVPMTYLSGYQTMKFTLKVVAAGLTLECTSSSNCEIEYSRTYTPTLYYISPPVVYYQSFTEFWFDPKSITSLIDELEDDEMPFINAKIGESNVDFEYTVEPDDSYSSMYKNQVRGQIGELPAGEIYNISMLWEVGRSDVVA
jgi:hypothetical protein